MPRKTKKPTKKAASKAIGFEDAVDAVASAIAMSVIAQYGSEADRATAVAWLKGWFSKKHVFLNSKQPSQIACRNVGETKCAPAFP